MKESRKTFLAKSILKTRLIKRAIQKKLIEFSLPDYTTFSIFSVVIGTAAGLAAVFFHNSIEFFNRVFFEQTAEGLFFLGTAAVIVIPAIGMLIQSLMIYSAPDIAKRKGISEVIKAVSLRGGYISFRTTIFHFLAPVICIGSGNTIGPEGPAAQLGGGVASKLASFFSLSDERIRLFTAAGTGAAIAAIFNTPLGGVFFALEIVLLNDFHTPTFSALILASVTASAISRILLGNESVFIFSAVEAINYSHLYLYAILGLFTGFISVLFIRYSNQVHTFFKKKIFPSKIPQWLAMVVVGLLVGVTGYFFKEIFGIGYEGINKILANSLTWQIVLVLLGLKFILVPLVIYSGGFGGLFAPSLFMGACFGYLFSYFVNYFWGVNIDPVTMVLVGMGAMLGGINTIPISAILIIFEMTQDYSYILPLMLAVIISTMLVQINLRGSIHLKHLEAEGFKLSEGKETNLLKSIRVSEIELVKIDLIPEETTLPQLMAKLIKSKSSSFYTINKEGHLSGIITETELRPIITEYETLKDIIVARDIANPSITKIRAADDLDYVLKLFGKLNLDQFPVVDSKNEKKVLGAVTRQNVIAIYNRESLKVNLASGLAKELKTLDKTEPSAVAPGYSLIEMQVPSQFLGSTLAELKLRNKFGLEVLMIKQLKHLYADEEEFKIVTPDPLYKLKRNDIMVIFGSDEKLNIFRKVIE